MNRILCVLVLVTTALALAGCGAQAYTGSEGEVEKVDGTGTEKSSCVQLPQGLNALCSQSVSGHECLVYSGGGKSSNTHSMTCRKGDPQSLSSDDIELVKCTEGDAGKICLVRVYNIDCIVADNYDGGSIQCDWALPARDEG